MTDIRMYLSEKYSIPFKYAFEWGQNTKPSVVIDGVRIELIGRLGAIMPNGCI